MTEMNIKIKAIKDGQMNEGEFFCYAGETYFAAIEPGTEEEGGDWYELKDELWNELDKEPHTMDKEFFDEYFTIVAPFEIYRNSVNMENLIGNLMLKTIKEIHGEDVLIDYQNKNVIVK